VGKPVTEDHIRILDDDGNDLPPNTAGTVFLKSPAVGRFAYFKDEGKTEGAYKGEWYTLGDVGYLDDDGWLFLTDRSAHLIISGGVNIYPAEVEAVLLTHPGRRGRRRDRRAERRVGRGGQGGGRARSRGWSRHRRWQPS
jgi:long-chain acyl-CoA synthetase